MYTSSENQTRLIAFEDAAKASGKVKWGSDGASHVRDVKWILENPRNFVDSHHGKPVSGIIEETFFIRTFLKLHIKWSLNVYFAQHSL